MATVLGAQTALEKIRFSPASKFIELVEYTPSNTSLGILDVTFKNGTVIRAPWCFKLTFESWRESPTHDAYFSKAIKGRMLFVTLRRHTHGKQISSPLQKAKQRRHLESGLKREHIGHQPFAQLGTVDRAGF
jgi:hypothetical protein